MKKLFYNPKPLIKRQDGMFLASALLLTTFFVLVALSIMQLSTSHYSLARKQIVLDSALHVSEAGVEKTLLELNQDAEHAPPAGEVELFSSAVKGRGTYQVLLEDGSTEDEKIVTSIGRIYFPATSSVPKETRKVKVTVVASDSEYIYAVHTGPGGLKLTNSASITNGQVFLGGDLDMQNTSKIGTEANPLEISVAGYYCPQSSPYAGYPRLCSDPPDTSTDIRSIRMKNSAQIYATTLHKNSANTTFLENSAVISGTISDDNPPPVSLPEDNRSAIKTAIQNSGTTMTREAASCSGSETRTWGNVHITGSGKVEIKNSCVVTITGDVWIDGGLTIENSAALRIGPALDSAPTFLIDGSDGLLLKNSATVSANSSNVAAKFITFYCGSGCSPDSTPTEATLQASTNIATISIDNTGAAPGSVFYARWSKVLMKNGTNVGALIGQRVEMQNSGNVTFGVQLGGGSGDVFAIKFYQEISN